MQKVITERQMFEACGEMIGWDISKSDEGKYIREETSAYWYGWRLRADVEKARNRVVALNHFKDIEDIFDHIDGIHHE